MCLLNLPKIMAYYGPIRNLWEGGYVGEGYLRIIKPYLSNGLRKNWQKNIHKGTLERKFFNHSCRQIIPNDEESWEPSNHHKYGGMDEVITKMISNHVLSCVHGNNGFFILY